MIWQDPYHLSLWAHVDSNNIRPPSATKLNADNDVTKLGMLPREFTISDIGQRSYLAQQALTYTWRLEAEVDGQLVAGGFAEAVTTVRPPLPPAPPPTFDLRVLGYDYYGRLLIKVTLPESNTYKPANMYEMFWSARQMGDGQQGAFESSAIPGNFGKQVSQGGKFLFEALDIRAPVLIDGEYTIGVRGIGPSGNAGPFSTRLLSLKAE